MKILAFAASSSKNSINKRMVEFAVSQLINQHEIEVLDLNAFEMPIYCIDKELENGIPNLALEFAQKIDNSDFLIISFAEHNGAYATIFKNIFDWISRIPNREAWGNKKMILMATAPGKMGGATVLNIAKNRFPYSGGKVMATFSLPNFEENFDRKNNTISNGDKREELVAILTDLTEN